MLPNRHPLRKPVTTLSAFLITVCVGVLFFGQEHLLELLLGWLLIMPIQLLVYRLDKRASGQNEDLEGAMIRLAATPLRLILLLGAVVFVALKTDLHLIAFCSSMVIANLYYLASELSGLIKEKP